MKNPPRTTRKLIALRLRDQDRAASYGEWRQIAQDLDRLEGADAWRQDDASDDYDYLLIRQRLARIRSLRRRGDARQLAFELCEGLHGNLGNLANPALYGCARVGTKQLIETYIGEVARCLDFLCAGDFADFPHAEKIRFFKRSAIAFGRSALMLSGGGTLGMFHLGVIKALHQQQLLPRVLSGSSAGAIIASAVAVRQDDEVDALLQPGGLNLDAFRALGLQEALRGGALMDSRQLEQCLASNLGEYSFVEAFDRTGRIVSITISPAQPHQQGRLLNYLTAPHVLLQRAVLASCAVPGVFAPVSLQARDYDGRVVPYMPGKLWADGTLSSDLPMLRLARLHNINHYIVSQVNPHVVPFLSRLEREAREGRGLAPLARELIRNGSRGALQLARKHLDPYGGGRVLNKLDNIVSQRYSGDVNIFPQIGQQRVTRLFSNPTDADIQAYIAQGERATWPSIERIRLQTWISRTFEVCLQQLKAREYTPVRTPRRARARQPGA